MATHGHNQFVLKYGHDGYPLKQHKKTNSPVKESSDLDDWFKSYGENKDLGFFPYVSLLCKTKNASPNCKYHHKIIILADLDWY